LLIGLPANSRRSGVGKGSWEISAASEFPIHDAADLVPRVELILRNAYPTQPTTQIRDRALLFIEWRFDVPTERLAAYLKHGKSDRHRAP
jgi:hypothetical protein